MELNFKMLNITENAYPAIILSAAMSVIFVFIQISKNSLLTLYSRYYKLSKIFLKKY